MCSDDDAAHIAALTPWPPFEGDCISAPLTRFRADYAGYFNDNSGD